MKTRVFKKIYTIELYTTKMYKKYYEFILKVRTMSFVEMRLFEMYSFFFEENSTLGL